MLVHLWMIGSALWVAYAGWLIASGATFPEPNLLVTSTVTLAPPIGAFGLGHVVAWVIRRGNAK